uniref:Uncharacterized protein n=1 Tax=Nicotiana tabacum TaxID=4097 RepID=A0A1S4D9N2_TOBAC|nr:PREDICTED: uncharacterized protein LOC107827489 [Nicotiana tabacum]
MVDDGLKKKGKTRAQKKKKDRKAINEEIEESKYMHALPFPQKQRREKLDKQFGNFLDVLKQLHVNLPFTEVLSQTPAYAKFLNEILSKKWKAEETLVVKLTEHCASIKLMPLSIFRKLEGEIGEIRSIHVPLLLADQTTIIPEGIVDDVLVQVDKFMFSVNFIVTNMEENREVPLILRRPFLATGRML